MNAKRGHTPAQGVASGKLARLAAMVSTMAIELRGLELNQDARARMLRMHQQLIDELAVMLRPELSAELAALRMRLDDHLAPPTTAELRIAHAQLKGWLESMMADPGRQLNADATSLPAAHRKKKSDGPRGGQDRDVAAPAADHRRVAPGRQTRTPRPRTR
jgi:hypothetical protein